MARATGQITARFADTTLLTQAQTNAAAEFALMTAVLKNQQAGTDYS